jgi:hypothetical protein
MCKMCLAELSGEQAIILNLQKKKKQRRLEGGLAE